GAASVHWDAPGPYGGEDRRRGAVRPVPAGWPGPGRRLPVPVPGRRLPALRPRPPRRRRPSDDTMTAHHETRTPMTDGFEFDPFDTAFFADPYPSYKVMRDEYPVYQHKTPFGRVWPHYWMLTRAEDVNSALSDWPTFSSSEGVLVD